MAKSKTRFAQLHNHSEYSLLDGMLHVEDMFRAAKEFGQVGIGTMDHGLLGAVPEAAKLSQKYDLPYTPGIEAYFVPDFKSITSTDKNVGGAGKKRYHLSLLATSNRGYQELSRLASSSFSEGRLFSKKHPLIDLESMSRFLKSGDVKVATGCIGSYTNQLYLSGDEKGAVEHIKDLQDIAGKENLYLEVMGHHFPEQNRVKHWHSKIGPKLGIPFLGTNDSHYLTAEDADMHQAFLCAGTSSTLENPGLSFSSKENWFADTPVMESYFPEDVFPGALSNAADIAESSTFKLDFSGTNHLIPTYPLPDEYDTEYEMLLDLCNKGLRRRYTGKSLKKAKERLDYELSVINNMGFNGYFLITWDAIDWGKRHGIRFGPGRGSAAGSIVSYCLGITDIEPISNNLTFERFLNPSRVSMPDIDIDIEDARREELVAYLAEKYGHDHVSKIATYGQLKPRSAIQSGALVNGLSPSEKIDLSKMMPDVKGISVREAISPEPPVRDDTALEREIQGYWKQAIDLRKEYEDGTEETKKALDTAAGIQGYKSVKGVHAAGIVITPGPSTDYFPLGNSNSEILACEYDKYSVEDLGFLKMDFLGLKNLTVISEAVRRIEADLGESVDIDNIPLDDANVLRMLADGETTSVFQMESPGMTRLAMDLQIDSIEDISACVALYRPGPLGSNFHKQFVESKHSGAIDNVIHEDMKEILADTHGVVVYQEQLSAIAVHYAGYSAAEADTFRKAVGKKDIEILNKQEKSFKSRMEERGYGNVSAPMWDMIVKFAEYAFNRAHTAAYAKIAYQTAWLKYYYPAQYGAGVIVGLDRSKAYDYFQYLKEIGVKVLAPDINKSGIGARTIPSESGDRSKDSLVLGFSAVSRCGYALCYGIVETRETGGRFSDIFDFTDRVLANEVKLNLSNFTTLATAGAFDDYAFGASRESIRLLASDILDSSRKSARRGDGDDDFLFDFDDIPEIDPWAETAKALKESKARLSDVKDACLQRDVIGFFIGDNPLKSLNTFRHAIEERYPEVESAYSVSEFLELGRAIRRDKVSVFGVVVDADASFNENNRKPVFITIEDEYGVPVRVGAFGGMRTFLLSSASIGDVVVVTGNAAVDSFTGDNRITFGESASILQIDTKPYRTAAETIYVLLDKRDIDNEELLSRFLKARDFLEKRVDREPSDTYTLRTFNIEPPNGRGGYFLDSDRAPFAVYLTDKETRKLVGIIEDGS